jgi:predicted permease
VGPALGRVFAAGDDRADSPYAVISYNYWQRRFGGRPEVLGRSFTLRNAVLTIIGIAPSGFIGETGGQQPDVWIPLRMQPSVLAGEDWLHDTPPAKMMWLHVFGRLKPGVTPAHAEAEANAIFKAGLESFYGAVASAQRRRELLDQRLKIRPGARGASETRSEFATSLTALLAAVGLLLLIACANLANLLLARGAARKPEMALRFSLGASRGRLIRQLVTESLVLAAMGGLAGLAAAYFLHGALVRMIVQSDRDFRMSFALDPLVLGFTLAITLIAAMLFGILPALHVTQTDAGSSLKEHSRSATGSVGPMRWGRLLVSLQLALSLPLLVGAGLLAQTLYNLQHIKLGYPAQRLLLVRMDTRAAGYDSARSGSLLRELLGRFRRIPGVHAASFSQLGVFSGGNSISGIEVEGYVPKKDSDRHSAIDVVGPGYFSRWESPWH